MKRDFINNAYEFGKNEQNGRTRVRFYVLSTVVKSVNILIVTILVMVRNRHR